MLLQAAQPAGEGAVAAKLQRDRPDGRPCGPASGSPAEPSGVNAADRYKPIETPLAFQAPANIRPVQAGWAGAVMTLRWWLPMSLRSGGGGRSPCAAAARWPDPAAMVAGYAIKQCFWAGSGDFDKTTTVLPYGLLY